MLTPGKKETLAFNNTHMISKKIEKSSRIVLLLNANKHNQDQINYGTGKEINGETIADAKEPLSIQWFNNSFIKLPIQH
ncbi:MAG: hypothetical protein HRT37_06840 [Alteromonadaceae bacterium]|nr:hypothetical protein [Alteromonadaceae bacterium]